MSARRREGQARQTVRAIGMVLTATGVLLLLFVGYQLWGTGLRTAQAQDRLEDELRRSIVGAAASSARASAGLVGGPTVAPQTSPSTAVPLRPEDLPGSGEAAGRIEIPDIDVDWVFVQGVSVADLKDGPGHYPQTPMPGQAGNAAIAGHRTTYGAPFSRIDEMEPGDEIIVTTVQGRFRYRMTQQRIVEPSQTEVLDTVPGRNLLTLTSCHPKYTARKRIIVQAELAGKPLSATIPGARDTGSPSQDPKLSTPDASFSGTDIEWWPTILWGSLAGTVWLGAAVAGRRWRRWPAYGLGVGPFLLSLFLFFEHVSRLLPASY